jgi:hypothetical protein
MKRTLAFLFLVMSFSASAETLRIKTNKETITCRYNFFTISANEAFPIKVSSSRTWVGGAMLTETCAPIRSDLLSLAEQNGGYLVVERTIDYFEEQVCVRGNRGGCTSYTMKPHYKVNLKFENGMSFGSQSLEVKSQEDQSSETRVTKLYDSKLKIQTVMDFLNDQVVGISGINRISDNIYLAQFSTSKNECRAFVIYLENVGKSIPSYQVKNVERGRCLNL